MSRGVSIHIGMNEIDASKYGTKGQLKNCENDAKAMAALAESAGFSVGPVLLSREATRQTVTDALKRAAADLSAGDMLLLTYAGHGSQVPDKNGDEPDAKDETWVLYDRQYVDDELYQAYSKFDKDVRILILSDSCHSGTVARELPLLIDDSELERTFDTSDPSDVRERVRALPSEAQLYNYERDQEVYDGIQRDLPAGDQQELSADIMLISGCQDNQTSSDGSGVNGLFTETLLKTWRNGGFQGTYKTLYRQIVDQMPPYQTPNLYRVGATNGDAFADQRPFTV
ncbi:caspase family protein [Streptomyces sp. B1866]|uniref:caspase family protein n=1 Tax=Streptomyces sp. B1866 TaxID=3075431 RepID=UPI002891D812|nr:caspase family protein [Streptomyces sp. B1866]MDT3396709.1 caspase family protein [Streptomyces sp. B1866]